MLKSLLNTEKNPKFSFIRECYNVKHNVKCVISYTYTHFVIQVSGFDLPGEKIF